MIALHPEVLDPELNEVLREETEVTNRLDGDEAIENSLEEESEKQEQSEVKKQKC